MVDDSLWGELSLEIQEKPPVAYLKEQANKISSLTKNILRGQVVIYGEFSFDLELVAPALNNYTYTILRMYSSLNMYPLEINAYGIGNYKCENEDQFVDAIRAILSSPKVHGVITSLVAQSKAIKS